MRSQRRQIGWKNGVEKGLLFNSSLFSTVYPQFSHGRSVIEKLIVFFLLFVFGASALIFMVHFLRDLFCLSFAIPCSLGEKNNNNNVSIE